VPGRDAPLAAVFWRVVPVGGCVGSASQAVVNPDSLRRAMRGTWRHAGDAARPARRIGDAAGAREASGKVPARSGAWRPFRDAPGLGTHHFEAAAPRATPPALGGAVLQLPPGDSGG
jgi:hypothetical protein